jgi:predicted GNAT family acetyltransferase
MTSDTNVTDNAAAGRFEWTIDGATAIVTYRREGSVLWLNHAGVPDALGGRGLGTRLVEAVLQQIRARGEKIVPVCSFIVRHIERHPQHRDLLAER